MEEILSSILVLWCCEESCVYMWRQQKSQLGARIHGTFFVHKLHVHRAVLRVWDLKFWLASRGQGCDPYKYFVRTRYRTKLGWFVWFWPIQRYNTTKAKWQILYHRTRYRSKLGWFFWFGPIHVMIRHNLGIHFAHVPWRPPWPLAPSWRRLRGRRARAAETLPTRRLGAIV